MKKSDIISRERISSIASVPALLEKIKKNEGDGYYRDSNKFIETIWDSTCFKAYKKPKSIDDLIFKKGFFLFNMVKNNAMDYLEERKGKVPDFEQYPVNFYNYEYDIHKKPNLVGIDLTAAYWYVARNLGVITEKTFERGLMHIKVEYNGETKKGDLLKAQRLSALSVLGKTKTYYKIIDGVKTKEKVTIGGHEGLDKTYRLIRNTCYLHMHTVMGILGKEEFVSWKTDAIYFHDTPGNRKKVMEYFDSVNLEYKLLEKEVEEDKPF